VDVARAKTQSPFGTTIAHGNLTLSRADGFRGELLVSEGFRLAVNYACNRVGFPAPVPVDSGVRASIEVASVDEAGGGWFQSSGAGRSRSRARTSPAAWPARSPACSPSGPRWAGCAKAAA
jgi:acyl dehydratase